MADSQLPEMPISAEKWDQLALALALPPQQRRIVELILRNCGDRQIALALGIKLPTLRTYMHRIYDRAGVSDRLELVLRIFAMAQGRNLSTELTYPAMT